MTAESALMVISVLESHGVHACIGGGWAIDALLGEQTREHADLDIWLPAADLDPMIMAFSEAGIDRLLHWGGDRPWNFVVHDGRSLRVDLHHSDLLGDKVFQSANAPPNGCSPKAESLATVFIRW
ncbi:nucleotidyltransferase domain-containing protein [Nocardia terpenica]|uniref:Aminoglycoside nucleotidyltransferase n=1 Tax=Nocardia terpenica TaxID=455432 RepID=A0A6G9Z7E1_9NOCA|nr:hypothetical protein [Nocardia terpenica]QIS21364.1 hypothetical protein F6W96_26555 [Nocardia terpenica]